MAKREIPETLRLKQERDRQETYKRIEDAAKLLRDEDCAITRRNLTEASGLAASTFSKRHVKEYLLKRWAIGADEVAASSLPKLNDLDEKEFGDFLKKIDDLRKRLISTENKLDKERSMRKKVELKHQELEFEIKVLRGELDISQRKSRILSGKKRKAEIINLSGR